MKSSMQLLVIVAGFTAAAALPVRAQIPQIQYQAEDALSDFPDDIHLGEAAGVARNSDGEIFVYTRTGNPTISLGTSRYVSHGGARIFRFDEDGEYEGEIGQETYGALYAQQLRISADDHIWAIDQMSGQVVRYVPARNEGPTVVADLGDRHAKEILVADVDGDGRDELYVSIEGHVGGPDGKQLLEPVEIRRYDADTPPGEGARIASLDDRLCRFLTAGDVDGDGRQEMVAATFSNGVWLLRPGSDPRSEWKKQLIDADSAGFEHAALLTDLDEDGTDELYVASDRHKELRRYTWNGERLVRETIYRRPDDRPVFTWNLMPVPIALVP